MGNVCIAGIDPASTRNLGWCLCTVDSDLTPIEDNSQFQNINMNWKGGTFTISPKEEKWQCLWPMFMVVDDFLNKYNPSLVVLEKTSSFSGGFITGQVSNCMGVILAVCGKHEIPVIFAYPTTVKKIVSGHGRSTKSIMRKSVKKIFEKLSIKDVKFDSEHSVDATANIIYWLIKEKFIPSNLHE